MNRQFLTASTFAAASLVAGATGALVFSGLSGGKASGQGTESKSEYEKAYESVKENPERGTVTIYESQDDAATDAEKPSSAYEDTVRTLNAAEIRVEIARIEKTLPKLPSASATAKDLRERLRLLRSTLASGGNEAVLVEVMPGTRRWHTMAEEAGVTVHRGPAGSYQMELSDDNVYVMDTRSGEVFFRGADNAYDQRWVALRNLRDSEESSSRSRDSLDLQRFLSRLKVYRDLKTQQESYARDFHQNNMAIEKKLADFEQMIRERLEETIDQQLDSFLKKQESEASEGDESSDESDFEKAMKALEEAEKSWAKNND